MEHIQEWSTECDSFFFVCLIVVIKYKMFFAFLLDAWLMMHSVFYAEEPDQIEFVDGSSQWPAFSDCLIRTKMNK